MKNNRKSKIIVLLSVCSAVIVSGLTFARLYHEDIENKIAYSLSDAAGKKITNKDFGGRWSLVTFGFTSCPDVCPLQALMMATTLKHLEELGLADRIVPVFISVDYLRDTPEKVQAYVDHFDKRFIGLSGTQAQLDLTVDAFQTRYEVSSNVAQGTVDVIHSSMLYLVDPSSRLIKQFPYGADASDLANDLGTYL